MTYDEAHEWVQSILPGWRVVRGGSSAINGRGKDMDLFASLALGSRRAIQCGIDTLLDQGFTSPKGTEMPPSAAPNGHCFMSFRKGDVNVILLDSYEVLRATEVMTEAMRALVAVRGAPCTKRERVAVAAVLRDGYNAEQATAKALTQVPEDYV